MKQQLTQKEERQRKFLVVLPLLVVPFLTLMFWALGGGSGNGAKAQSAKTDGINTSLPGANFGKEKPQDKMGYYDHAASDSAKLTELIKKDPYYKSDMSFSGAEIYEEENPEEEYASGGNTLSGTTFYRDPNEEKVYDKLQQLDAALKENSFDKAEEEKAETGTAMDAAAANSADMDRLERMMQAMSANNETDPELQQLDAMLERILDIQHPERVKEKLRQASEAQKGRVLAVTPIGDPDPVGILANNFNIKGNHGRTNGFYSLLSDVENPDQQNAIEAVVHETQTIVNGSTVKLRLLNDIMINGVQIPCNEFIYGTASLDGERLRIQVKSMRYKKSLFPVSLSVYDMDGLAGIYVPGAITRDVAKQSADRSLQGIGITSVNPTWQAQAAGAGIEAARTLFSKKVKLIKVTLKAGYRVLLYDEKQKNN